MLSWRSAGHVSTATRRGVARRRGPRWALAALACLVPLAPLVPFVSLVRDAHAAQGAGTVADPVRVDLLPYALAASTDGAPSNVIDFYEPCAPTTDETGPERIFVFTLPEEARVTAWLEGDGGGVDVDVQLLDDLSLDGAVATSCLARGNVIAEALMSAGTHFVVVDSYAGAAQAGDFVLHLDAVGPTWSERTVAQGVTWRARRHVDPQLGAQLEHVLVIDPATPGVSVEARQSSGCQTIGQMGAALGAVAGVNGGYFDVSTCAPVSLLKHDGALVASNGVTRGAFGLSPQHEPLVSVVAAGADWPDASEAHGGGPVLGLAGNAYAGNSQWATEGFSSAGFIGVNPRTFAGKSAAGHVVLGTVDGRRPTAAGMTLDQLAAFAMSADVGCVDAVNLDGGGSTTMWIAGALTSHGVINYPSDGPDDESALHPGSRGVSGGFFVFAPAFNHPPRIQSEPSTEATAGSPYEYDLDAIDLDVDDVLTYSVGFGPEGMTIDAETGVVSFTPTETSPSSVEVQLVVSDDQGATSDQVFVLTIEGANGPPIGGGGEGPGGAGGAPQGGASAGAQGVGAGVVSQGGTSGGSGVGTKCNCSLDAGEAESDALAWLAGLTLAFGVSRRATRRVASRRV